MNAQEIQSYKKAGQIAVQMREYARELIKPKMPLLEIAEKIEAKIIELDGEIAFPVNLSINEVSAHYTPSANDKTKAEDLLKVDLGVEINGYIADTAFSLDLTDNKKFKEMIELNKKIHENELNAIKPGIKVGKIGTKAQEVLEEYNKKNKTSFSIVRNLSGHSLGQYEIHAGLSISNYKNEKQDELNDIAIAIEPFVTTGKGEIYNGKPSEIFMLQNEKQIRDKDARELLKFIKENYKTKPFCKRWLEKQGFKKIDFLLGLLVKQEILHNFPVLIEKTKKPVSQEEHTVIIHNKVEVITR